MNKPQVAKTQGTYEGTVTNALRPNNFRITRKSPTMPKQTFAKTSNHETPHLTPTPFQMETSAPYPKNTTSKQPALMKLESQGSQNDVETNTVPKSMYDSLVKEHRMQMMKAEMEIKSKDDRIKNLEQQLREVGQLASKLEEKNKVLAQENAELKRQDQEMKLKKPSSQTRANTNNQNGHQTTGGPNRNANNRKRNIPDFEELFEEDKQEEKPPDMPLEEWQSLQLAIQLQREEARAHMRQRARMMMALNEIHMMRALHEAQMQSGFDPNRSLSSINTNQINPDNMSYEQLLQLGEKIGHVSKGLKAEEIKKIPKTIYRKVIGKAQDEKQCSICFCEFEDGDKLRKLGCKHDFHSKCIKKWLVDNKTCPVCKKEVV